MTKITFIANDGVHYVLDAKNGISLMEVARDNSIPGIQAECGGACSCATCLVHVDAVWFDRIPPAAEAESSMLEFANHVQENSRLSCQITVTGDLDGMVVTVPESQQ